MTWFSKPTATSTPNLTIQASDALCDYCGSKRGNDIVLTDENPKQERHICISCMIKALDMALKPRRPKVEPRAEIVELGNVVEEEVSKLKGIV